MISEMITTAIETVTIAAVAATIRDSESKYFSNVLIGGFPLLDLCLNVLPTYKESRRPGRAAG